MACLLSDTNVGASDELTGGDVLPVEEARLVG